MKKNKKKQKNYNFNFKIYWKDGSTTTGEVIDSSLSPTEILLSDAMTIYGSGKAFYYNLKEIKQVEVTDLVEKVQE